MPTRKSRLTRTEARECRARLLQLEKMGIQIGRGVDFWHEPNGITLEQIDHELARFFELPLGEVAVVAFAKQAVLVSGMMITEAEMTTPWGFSLDSAVRLKFREAILTH